VITNLLKVEFYCLSRRRGWIALCLFMALLIKGVIFLAMRYGAFGDGMDNGFAYLTMSGTYSLFLISFLMFIISASSLSGEYSSGLLRMYLTRPVSRTAWFLNRSLFLGLVVFLLLLLDAGAGLLYGSVGFDFKDVADPLLQGPQFAAGAMAVSTLKAYLYSFLAIFAVTSVGLMISVMFRAPVVAISVAAGLFFFMEGARHIFLEPTASYILTKYTSEQLRYLSSLARGFAEYQSSSYFLKEIGAPLVYLLLANTLGLFIFKKRDILD